MSNYECNKVADHLDYSKILWQAYEQYLLPLGNKVIPTPYRRNTPFQFDHSKYGKSDPQTLLKDVLKIAKQKKFDLDKASEEEIKKFMKDNLLGIDCSGFVYHLLNHLLQSLNEEDMQKVGFPKASKTNVATITSDELSTLVDDFSQTQPGDVIKLNSGEDILHCLIILDNINNVVTYAHSSSITTPTGVHTGQIINGRFPKDLSVFNYDTNKGDGIRRLKILKCQKLAN